MDGREPSGPIGRVLDAAAEEMIEIEEGPAAAPPRRPALATFLLAATIVLVAFNLRVAVTSLGPVLRDAVAATGMSNAVASLLTTIPSFCFGVFGPLAPFVARRLGTERAMLLLLALLTAGCALRGLPQAALLFTGQAVACVSIGLVNVLLPGLIKRHFSGGTAVMTGLYTMAFCAGAAIAAGATVPIQNAAGGSWALALAFWALPAGLAVLAWLPQARRATRGSAGPGHVVRGLWRDPLAWQLTLFMGSQSALAYILFGWMVPMVRDRGLDAKTAGLVLSVSVMAQAVSSLVVPWLATRGRDQRFANGAAVVLSMLGLAGCLYAPIETIWVWTVVLGLAQGGLISLALTQIVLRAGDAHVAAHLSSMCQGVGYCLASFGPLFAGLLHGWVGGWNGVALFCLAIGLIMLPCGIGAGRAMHVGAVSEPAA